MKKIVIISLTLVVVALGLYIINSEATAKDNFVFPNNSQLASLEELFQNLPELPPAPGSIRIPIIIYHSVRPYIIGEAKLQDDYDITPEMLEKQLVYLRDNGYTTITMDDFVKYVKAGTPWPVIKPVVLSFDDGWRNQYKYAFPLLQKYHDTAIFYIYTNPIGQNHFLTWDEIREMDKAGMTIGDHTLSHPYLKGLSSDQLKKEIIDSKKIIESQIGKPVLHFASPFGYTSPEIVKIISDAGYLTGRTTFKGIYHSKKDLLSLRGILVTDSFDEFTSSLVK